MERDADGQQTRGRGQPGPGAEVEMRDHARHRDGEDGELPAREPLAPDLALEHDRDELVAGAHDRERDPPQRDGVGESEQPRMVVVARPARARATRRLARPRGRRSRHRPDRRGGPPARGRSRARPRRHGSPRVPPDEDAHQSRLGLVGLVDETTLARAGDRGRRGDDRDAPPARQTGRGGRSPGAPATSAAAARGPGHPAPCDGVPVSRVPAPARGAARRQHGRR